MKRLLAWANSWVRGRTVGEVVYVDSLPFVVGDIRHFIPRELQTQEERDALRYCLDKYVWDGFSWRFVEHLEMPREKLVELLKESVVWKRSKR